jgi:hypothetical protein
MTHDCGEKHCQVCAVLYGFTAVHFSPCTTVPCRFSTRSAGEHLICAWAGHTEEWSDWYAQHSTRATEPAGEKR